MSDEQTQVSVVNNPDRHRYEATVDGAPAGYATYRADGGQVVFLHTEVDDRFEGHGVGSRLAAEALDDVRASGRHVVARCPFIAAYIDHHPEYQDLLAS